MWRRTSPRGSGSWPTSPASSRWSSRTPARSSSSWRSRPEPAGRRRGRRRGGGAPGLVGQGARTGRDRRTGGPPVGPFDVRVRRGDRRDPVLRGALDALEGATLRAPHTGDRPALGDPGGPPRPDLRVDDPDRLPALLPGRRRRLGTAGRCPPEPPPPRRVFAGL